MKQAYGGSAEKLGRQIETPRERAGTLGGGMGGALLRRTLLLSGSLDEMQCALAELRARNAELEARIVWRTSQLQAANVAGTRKDELLVAERAARAGAERAERRSTFLAEASRVLASTEEENTPAIVARLAVRHVAEWCLAHAVDQSGSFRRVETACADGVAEANREPHDGLIGMQAGQSGSPPGITTAFAPEALDSLVEALTRDPEHPRILGELGDRSMMVVLLQARGRSTGALAFVAPAPGPCYDLEDLLLAEDLAGRAALVSENARLHRQREEIARTLQQSMLPPRLPDIPGLELASTYCPVGDGIEVGGDFYDLFATGDQCWGIVMGDVSGQGSGAAAIALLARYTVRALAVAERQPSRILTLLNGVMLQHLEGQQHSDERFCTVAYARLEPTALLLRGDGTVETIGDPGTFLGCLVDPRLTDRVTDLAPCDTVVFYTDGVTEAGRSGNRFGEARLRALLGSCVGLGAGRVADRIQRTVEEFQGGPLDDDMAILVCRIESKRSHADDVEVEGSEYG
jgi:serine phosphatase RsbU (regulator of sigma subunit)